MDVFSTPTPEGVKQRSPRLPARATLGITCERFSTPTGLNKGGIMPQSLSVVYVHLVFSTKERRPFFQDRCNRSDMHAYLAVISNNLNCPAIIVGGHVDHVHICGRLHRTVTQSEPIESSRSDRLHSKPGTASCKDELSGRASSAAQKAPNGMG